MGDLGSAVQFGFIFGTFVFALLTISDRFSPSKVFFICATTNAIFNLGLLYGGNTMYTLLSFRFFVGVSLAGIYPIGMKIASDHFEKGLGKSLSFLLAALVLGKSFPYLIKSFDLILHWESVIWITSTLSLLGGLLIISFVGNGPYQKLASRFEISKIVKVFKNAPFRSAAFGYFGHMWELYAFWTFLPVLILTYSQMNQTQLNVPLITFGIIGIGAVGCVIGGMISKNHDTKKTAVLALSISGLCCLLSPLVFFINYSPLFIGFLIIWGMTVVADSPLFSTLVALSSQPESKGTALTIVNCIGFAITIVSIQLINYLILRFNNPEYVFMVLALGPIFGLLVQRRKSYSTSKSK